MSAVSLTPSEQRSAFSGKKKKKKNVKNVLGIPDGFKLEFQSLDASEINKLNDILNRLLPSARLPVQQNGKFKKESSEQTEIDPELKEKATIKRNQLALGVNVVNKSIKKNLISAVLLANDIQPKFLINHLNLLCEHNKIPFLYFPQLRKITLNNLGFPCIAIGFKKNSTDFSEAIDEIKSIFNVKKVNVNYEEKEEIISEVCDEAEITNVSAQCEENTKSFTYLYRTSVKERVFVPENRNTNLTNKKSNVDFLSIDKKSVEPFCEKNNSPMGISSNLISKKLFKGKKAQYFIKNIHNNDDDDDDEEDLEVPRKKPKKDWIIDKIGTKKNYKYHPAKLHKIPSNCNRNLKK